MPWSGIHVFQVDERVAPAGDPDRNATHIAESLLSRAPIAREQVHLMPVEAPDLPVGARRYADTLAGIAGTPAVLDLVHRALGPDGHTASLVPGDPVLGVTDADVALTGAYQSHRRMTLTYPALNRARRVPWLVTGDDKPAMLARLRAGDPTIPAANRRRRGGGLRGRRRGARPLRDFARAQRRALPPTDPIDARETSDGARVSDGARRPAASAHRCL